MTHCLLPFQLLLTAANLNNLLVSEECVDGAFGHLKPGNSDGTSILSDNLLFPALRKPLAYLFTAILRHGYVRKSLRN